ncbi:MAG: glycogen debranching enzyme N-terminal domain-containing protein, partial [Isosphaeraceae bacterium]|nr:glycogen debranching enzyme N-terminal domain-containing protein [Isosphaeraceae bacterium]
MAELVRTMPWSRPAISALQPLLTREWLVTNGLGGYASGTVAGVATRRYHGLLIAALPAPLGRVMMLNHLSERIQFPDGTVTRLGGHEHTDRLRMHGAEALVEFRLEEGMPVWRFEMGGIVLEKRIELPHQQNTTHITYRLISGRGSVRVRLQPSMN